MQKSVAIKLCHTPTGPEIRLGTLAAEGPEVIDQVGLVLKARVEGEFGPRMEVVGLIPGDQVLKSRDPRESFGGQASGLPKAPLPLPFREA